MNEELLEIQVWGGVLCGGRRSGASGRPQAEDELLGLAYVPLVDLLSHCNKTDTQIRYLTNIEVKVKYSPQKVTNLHCWRIVAFLGFQHSK